MSCSKNLFLLNKKVTACTAAVSSFGRLGRFGRFGRLRRLGRFCFWYDRSKGPIQNCKCSKEKQTETFWTEESHGDGSLEVLIERLVLVVGSHGD